MKEEMIDKIASAAMEAMLYEVSATPKPGLVDRNNCGAHKDMDYFTFMTSAAALHASFDEMIRVGIEYRKAPVKELLSPIRKCGIRAEERMFSLTKGVNTHKGMIFTLGILCGCAGWYLGKGAASLEKLCELAAEMCEGICAREYAGLEEKEHLTKGEQMYLQYGLTGARGEVESGYETVRTISLPLYTELRERQVPVNEALVQTLLHLIAETADTNILSRHNWETAEYANKSAQNVLAAGGIFSEKGQQMLMDMDQDFIERYISPGGCADLLAVTHFLYTLKEKEIFRYYIFLEEECVEY